MNLDAFEIGLLSVLIFCFISRMLFTWIITAKPYYYMKSADKAGLQNHDRQPPVSVIICMKSSTHDIYRFLPDILEQDYPEFEVVVVTDGISDADDEALKRLMSHYSNLYSTHVPDNSRNISRKKLALTLGIKAAKYDKLLFTEPDCRVRTKDWIYLMSRNFSDKKSIVLGFSALDNSNSISYKYMAYDYFMSNLQMISFALHKQPYSGNGRNMGYAKEHFTEQKGFVKYRTLQQGEDDLFINEIATCENTAIELTPRSITFTEINDFNDWKHRKADRMATQRYYKRGPVAFQRLEAFLRIVFFALLITSFICAFPFVTPLKFILPGIAFLCYIIHFFSLLIIHNKTCELLQIEKFYTSILLFDLFQPFINSYFFIYQLVKGKENYTYRYEKR